MTIELDEASKLRLNWKECCGTHPSNSSLGPHGGCQCECHKRPDLQSENEQLRADLAALRETLTGVKSMHADALEEAELLRAEIRVLWKCIRNKATEQQSLEAVKRGDYMTSDELLSKVKVRTP